MQNNKVSTILLILLILLSLALYALWGVQLLFWSLLFVYIRNKVYLNRQPPWDTFFLDLVGFGYPLLEIIIKIYIVFNIIPYSWFWLNRVEHIIFSMFMSLLLFPLVVRHSRKPQDYFFKIAAVILFIGTLNEVIEFIIRTFLAAVQTKSVIYYSDTIYDEVMNIIGMLLGFLLIHFKEKGTIKHPLAKRKGVS